MRNILIPAAFMLFLLGCVEDYSSDGDSYASNESATDLQPPYTENDPLPEQHEDVEIIEVGTVPIEEYIDEDYYSEDEAVLAEESQEFVGYDAYTEPTVSRLEELMAMNRYKKNNGKLKRHKIAQQLNKEGYRTSSGKKYRIRDIPHTSP